MGLTQNGKTGSLGVYIGLKDRPVIKISKIFITERLGMSACLGLQRCTLLHLPAFLFRLTYFLVFFARPRALRFFCPNVFIPIFCFNFIIHCFSLKLLLPIHWFFVF
ncbi:hypothetical protein FTN76_01915 [Chlamydia trachomatis]|uniref:Membrane protein n=3 Tax=Chlamydia trachomatis TaxID=813 RepID=A0A0H3MBL7_CHLT2|nr:hypothetical protein [Chlamydia trachomatis]CDG42085.1 putative membrane protein (pseudogene) [Chlamydia trachomatis F/SWFPminus]CDG42974.1 putative membrane protein (pseudogene) [Chlamydia trachomatis E/C599]AAA75631.1 corresponds to 107 amino acid long polypeptide [Chlamydia trachomatis]AKC30313.1 membrane protein [Chlamydia trachomatis]AKC31223.1 membrane protein [Chlamydia trachomatis]